MLTENTCIKPDKIEIYKAKELESQRKYKHKTRQDRDYKAKELESQRKYKHKARQDKDNKARELVANRKHMHKTRQDRDYKAKELESQRKYKLKARQDKDYKEGELVVNRKHMQKNRQDRDNKANELESQRKYKQNARKNLFVLECKRVKKQEYRRNKRRIDEMHECTDLEETHNKRKKKLDDHEKTSYQRHFKDIKECIKQFHSVLSGGCRCLTEEEVPLRLGLFTRPVSEVGPDSLTPSVFLMRLSSLIFGVLGGILAARGYGAVLCSVNRYYMSCQCLWRV